MKQEMRPGCERLFMLAMALTVVTRFALGSMCAAANAAGESGENPTLASEGAAATRDAPKSITVDAAAQARFGIAVVTLHAASAPTGSFTSARVLDPGPLLQLDNELATAAAALAASHAEAERTRKLFAQDRTASAQAMEAANAQEQADVQRVSGIQRRLALEWGEGLAALPANRRAALLNDLARTRAELVRVEVPGSVPAPKPGSGVRVRSNGDSGTLTGTVLGTLPLADIRLQTRGVLAELKGDAANLPIGQMLVAEIATAGSSGTSGVVVPRSALLRRDSRVWAYVQTAPSTFLRKEVVGYRPSPAGWFVADGFAPGDRVVIQGAAALLGVESPAPADADESDD
jgi:hypothetical protein